MSGVFASPEALTSVQIYSLPGPNLPYDFTREGANAAFNALTTTGDPTVTTITSPANYISGMGTGPYRGLVLATNNKLYSAPWAADAGILVIDSATDTASIQSFGVSGLGINIGKFTTGCLAPNGKIYFPPFNHDKILVIDPANGTSYYLSQTFSTPSYSTAVLGANGKIYCLGKNNCLIINPANDTLTTTSFDGIVPSNSTSDYYWLSGVRCLVDNKLYFVGRGYNYLIVIDTSTGTNGTAVRNNFGLTNMRNRGLRYGGIANGQDGLLHLTPYNATSSIYGPSKKFYGYIQPIGGGSAEEEIFGIDINLTNIGAVNGDDGGVYSIPYAAGLTSGVYVYNRNGINNAQYGTFNIGIPADRRWFGGCLAPNGKIYSLPDMGFSYISLALGKAILVTNTAGTGRTITNFRNLIDTSYFNKGGT